MFRYVHMAHGHVDPPELAPPVLVLAPPVLAPPPIPAAVPTPLPSDCAMGLDVPAPEAPGPLDTARMCCWTRARLPWSSRD